jgi:hydroxymethylbilane synthase
MSIRIGTRASKLARAQAEKVSLMLQDLGEKSDIVCISTAGDEQTTVPLHEIGGQGVFVRALDDALISGNIDIAVHSMKDIPAERPEGVITSAILKRDSPGDFLVTNLDLNEVKSVGTSSTRRTAQFKRFFPGITIGPLRGNVDTRLSRLKKGDFDAVVLAHAGLQRLSLDLPGFMMDPEVHVPSTNQGTIAVVSRSDSDVNELLKKVDDYETRVDTMLERRVMEEIGGGCFTPLGIYCKGRFMHIQVLSLEGDEEFTLERKITDPDDAGVLGKKVKEDAGYLIREAYSRLGLK